MAENEMLDFGSPRRYRRWKAALRDEGSSEESCAAILREEFLHLLRGKLRRGGPIHLLLRASNSSPEALRGVIESLKDKYIVRVLRNAIASCGSTDPDVVARAAVVRMVEDVVDKARLQTLKAYPANPARCREMEGALRSDLSAATPTLVNDLKAALLDLPIPRSAPRPKPSVQSVAATSLMK